MVREKGFRDTNGKRGHPHQRPSLLYDHISCDGQCFLFVRSLTDDHPSKGGYPLASFLAQVQCLAVSVAWTPL